MTCLLGLLEYRILRNLYGILTRNGITSPHEVLKQTCLELGNNEEALFKCVENNYSSMWKVANTLAALGYISVDRLGNRIALLKWRGGDTDFTKVLMDYINHKESTKAR